MSIRAYKIGVIAFQLVAFTNAQAPLRVQMVNVGIVAEQKKGAGPLTIEVTEHKQPLAVQELRPASALPRRILILVDQSGSAGHLAAYYRSAITQIVETLPDYSRDTVAIGAFNDTVGMIVPFTNNKLLLLEKLDKLGGKGRTKLYDAVFLGIGSAIVERKKSGGLADIIVVSDGGENGSAHSLEDIANTIHTSRVRVSALDVHGPELLATIGGVDDIERISEIVRTGGGISISTTYDDHAAQIEQFITNLKNSYFVRLQFATPAQGYEKHHIEIHASKGWKLDYPSIVYVPAAK